MLDTTIKSILVSNLQKGEMSYEKEIDKRRNVQNTWFWMGFSSIYWAWRRWRKSYKEQVGAYARSANLVILA